MANLKEQFTPYVGHKRPKDPRNVEFGHRLSEICKQRNVHIRELCATITWSKASLYKWTSGRKEMRVGTFAKIVDRLSLTPLEVAHLLEAYWEDDDG